MDSQEQMASPLLFHKVTWVGCEFVGLEQPRKMWSATQHYVWPYLRVITMSFFFAQPSFVGCEGCCPCSNTSEYRGRVPTTGLPFLDSDPLVSQVMGEEPFHFEVIVSRAILPLASRLFKRAGGSRPTILRI